MPLKWPQHPEGAHVRTCQECGHAQVAKDPNTQKGEGWKDLKCRRCKSEGSFDFGSTNVEQDDSEDQ